MIFLISLLGIVFFSLFMKFIWDTYLTNNTEKRWQEHVRHNQTDKEYFERKFPQHQDSNAKLQYKGFYLYKKETEHYDGSTGVNMYGLFFNNDDAFFFSTTRDYPIHVLKSKIPTLFTPTTFAYREAVSVYGINGVSINVLFERVADQGDFNCNCKLINNGMIVTISQEFNIRGTIESIPLLDKCRFDFHPIDRA